MFRPLRNIKNFADRLAETIKDVAKDTAIEIWFQDEARVGQKNGLVYQWAKKGTRPRQPKDQRYASCYIFGAVCPARGEGAALVLPYADTAAMQKHLDEISRCVRPKAHAVVLMDGAGWHKAKDLKAPENLSLMFIPPYAPELNPVENIWQFLRQTYLSNQVFEDYDKIVEACCKAWNNLTKEPRRITSIASRKWANIG
jgi:transposase